jgi:ribosomal protein S12 methylthiotransferase accessory factor
MNVALAGAGPAADAVRAALADENVETETLDPERLETPDLGIVVGETGDRRFGTATRAARAGSTPWLAVELGGIGGHALSGVTASVAGFGPGTACYRCLGSRVAANAEGLAESPEVESADARLAGAHAGRAALELLAGETGLLGHALELPHAERAVLPVPGCPVCDGERDRTLTLEHADVGLEDALAAAERALDERVGLVSSVGEAESFPAPYYLAATGDTTGFSDARAAEHAAGVAIDWNEALMKALGEALERYSAGVYRESGFTVARPVDLPNAVPSSAFVLPGEGYATPDAEESIPWVRGTELASGGTVTLPAEFVHFPPPTRTYRPAITTGLGLGSSSVGAVLSGLYEVLERDATMLAWYSTFEPLALTVDDEGYRALERRARAEDLEATALLVTQDVDVPVVAVAVHRDGEESGDGEWPRFAVGSGAALDPDAAARSALAEALQNWMELRRMGPEAAAQESGAIGEYADFPATVREWIDADGPVPSASVGPETVPEGEAELRAVLDRLADVDLSAYAARLTTRDVELLGFEAVRVLVPDAQPLFTGDPFFGERARRVPAELGFEPWLDREFHPYP